MNNLMTNRKVLVLNKNYVAIAVISLEKAIIMLFGGEKAVKAEIIDDGCIPHTWDEWAKIRPKNDDEKINSAHNAYCIPKVIKVNTYDKLPTQRIHFSRRTIYKRDNNHCLYCKKKFSTENLSLDHIIPRSVGGLTTWTNVCLACIFCNKQKADRVPKKYIANIDGKFITNYLVYFKGGRQVQIREPNKPNYNFYIDKIHYNSWKQWLNESYWSVELENDN